ncbi:leucyl aminopeptidase [Herbaspirillum sp. RTI4]|uniref:leucyl aminopeptidase n=1 Tax=Herbaspirillum sp. RTI4 TaxID=3048640 RepID=UPI002AB41AEA|nr:leucyl aminopeptidase [Herbaspirillum sp. RTI4]MDY7578156.1 leucyl aminopeptidase [Herbaspirillum sp. RTI4]MEA9980745.1 leucyl aminopeptidase [Herbaspirillum sp. RTI4]
MDFSIKTLDGKTPVTAQKTGCLVVGVLDGKKLASGAQALAGNPAIVAALKSGDLSGKPGSTLLLRDVAGVTAQRVLLVGMGSDEAILEKSFSTAAASIIRTLATLGATDALLALPLQAIKDRDAAWAINVLVAAGRDSIYRPDALKSKKDPVPTGVSKIAFAADKAETPVFKLAIAQSVALANGVELTKELGNLAANVCTPTYLANTAKKLARDFKLGVEVLDRKQLEALKMGSFLSVTNGSDQPPKFIVIKHLGGKIKDAPVVLVGKGITFDSGGISLKPGSGMDEMKYDMCGAASVLGTFRAIAEMQLKLNVIGIIPTCENMPSGSATKPGDIVTSMAGLTIEVLNTDAEGRLVLCDALTYAERFNPAVVVDIATLTGACIVALGHHNSGLFTRSDAPHDKLANELLAAGKTSGDTAWRMPIEDAYQEQLKSNFADIANIGGQPAGSVTAACFLERFTKKYTWAHLDIAGTAWKSGAAKGATGRPVPLLTNFLIGRAKAA